jgi:pimeloyl-ACP methyl ester carboxylesterase
METSEVIGNGGVRLHVRETGPRDAPAIVLVHGWSQSWLSWKYQFESSLRDEFRLVALDLRGHGMSERPEAEEAYTDAQVWADDLAAVIEQRELQRPVLVGWSFGGYVACDYIRAYGQSGVSAVNFVGWAVMLGSSEKERALAGRGFHDYYEASISEDMPTSIAAMRGFIRACVARELSPEDMETALSYNVLVPSRVRRALGNRPRLDNTELLSTLQVPVLVSQGAEDRVTTRAAAEHILGCCPTARLSLYEGVGHSPFLEDPDRFSRELGQFAREATAADTAEPQAQGGLQ